MIIKRSCVFFLTFSCCHLAPPAEILPDFHSGGFASQHMHDKNHACVNPAQCGVTERAQVEAKSLLRSRTLIKKSQTSAREHSAAINGQIYSTFILFVLQHVIKQMTMKLICDEQTVFCQCGLSLKGQVVQLWVILD